MSVKLQPNTLRGHDNVHTSGSLQAHAPGHRIAVGATDRGSTSITGQGGGGGAPHEVTEHGSRCRRRGQATLDRSVRAGVNEGAAPCRATAIVPVPVLVTFRRSYNVHIGRITRQHFESRPRSRPRSFMGASPQTPCNCKYTWAPREGSGGSGGGLEEYWLGCAWPGCATLMGSDISWAHARAWKHAAMRTCGGIETVR